MNFNEYQQLYSDLLQKQRTYERYRKWFKPILIVAAIAVLVGTVLPFLLPLTAPIVIIGALALILRWVLYRFVFKNPATAFREAYHAKFLRPLLHELHPQLAPDKWRALETKELNSSQLFVDYIDESRQHGAATLPKNSAETTGGTLKLAWFRLVREKVTLGGLLHDFAEDVFMELTGDDGDFDEERNHKIVSVFSGLIFQSKFEGQGNWLVLPTKLLELYKKQGRYPALPARALSDQLTLFVPEQVAGPSKELQMLFAEQTSVFVRSDDTHLWIALPRKHSLLQVDLDDADTISENDFNQFKADVQWLKAVQTAIA